MNGIIFWAYTNCRSTIALYKNIADCLNVPFVITFWYMKNGVEAFRTELGFSSNEFTGVKKIPCGENYVVAKGIANKYKDWNHIFCVYQKSKVYQRIMSELKKDGAKVAVFSEAPCNMFYGIKRLVKSIYLKWILPGRVSVATKTADFFVNFSGDSTNMVINNKWAPEKIIPFGYFPPPIEGSSPFHRVSNTPFNILSSGALTRHRGADVLIKALKILKEWGVKFQATITQDGELLPFMQNMAEHYKLPVSFPGRVSIEKLINLYETCTVYVGSGRDEPWGMRLNDVLQCAAPLIVSRGMGGVSLVDYYKCGVSFEREDYVDLANKLRMMAINNDFYKICAENAYKAAKIISPERMASFLILEIKSRFPGWLD